MTKFVTDEKAIEMIRVLSREGCPLHNNAPSATINNTEWFYSNGIMKSVRAPLHVKLFREQTTDADVGRKAIVLAGPPGAGKSTIARRLQNDSDEIWQIIDPDIFKRGLLREALDDGSYEDFIKPNEIKQLEGGCQEHCVSNF